MFRIVEKKLKELKCDIRKYVLNSKESSKERIGEQQQNMRHINKK